MGFKGKGKGLPAKITDLVYSDLHNSQVYVLADWMGVRHRLTSLKSEELRRKFLRDICDGNIAHAQRGYEVICLHKDAVQNTAGTAEEKLYSIVGQVIESSRSKIDEYGMTVFTNNLNKVLESLEQAKVELRKDAQKALREAAEKAVPFVIKQGTKTRKVKGTLPEEFKRMVQLGAARKNIMLVGPAGCGKTYLAAKLAEALDLDFADQSCSAGLSESAFTGWLLPVGKGGQFDYVSSPFIKLYENGGVFLFDEMDAADANLLTFLNKALANDSFYLPQRHTKPLVKRHPDFVAIGAANTYGHGADAMYVGRNQLDAATLDRFRVGMITMDYSKEVEQSIGSPKLLEWAWKIREAIRVKSLRRVMSTRTIKDLADMSEQADWEQKDWAQAYFTDWSPEELSMIKPFIEQVQA